MGKPITTVSTGICFAFPDVCLTPAAPSPVSIPYPNIGQLSSAVDATKTVRAKGHTIVTSKSSIQQTSGDEAGSAGGANMGKVEFKSYSMTVKAEGQNVVRMFDTTSQNNGVATGQVLGGEPTVLVGD